MHHSDRGSQYACLLYQTQLAAHHLMVSMSRTANGYDNAVIESFWGRMQTELLNRRRWRTRIELANAIFEYLEIFHNRQRRHSLLGYLSPSQFEIASQSAPATA